MIETFLCPRRDEIGTPFNLPKTDHWNTEQVTGVYKASSTYIGGKETNLQLAERHCSFGEFRTCSYCGSIHPQDVLDMRKKGWRAERSDKPYKGYMHAPRGEKAPQGVGAMKFYTMHFTPEQLKELNES